MHLRRTSVKRKTAVYTYVQLVESYRRKDDGIPATRVIANLGRMSDLQFRNFQHALEASRLGKSLVVKGNEKGLLDVPPLKPRENLRFLDIAVLLEVWREYGLEKYFHDLFKNDKKNCNPALVLIALVLQRCVDPDSKLAATRWFPNTVLPEFTAIAGSSFNNSRIHRTLELLEQNNAAIMANLPNLLMKNTPVFATLFLDVTDTWFVGNGPSSAQRGKTKEGMTKKKIGIVLICNEEGFPLRWDVVPGVEHDSKSILMLLFGIKGLSWVKKTPIVCDRAMGKTSLIAEMHDMGIRYITALTRPEFSSYVSEFPKNDLDVNAMSKDQIIELSRNEIRHGRQLKEVDENLFILDCGIVTKKIASASSTCMNHCESEDHAATAMKIARHVNQGLADKVYSTIRDATIELGISKVMINRYRVLSRLPLDLQDRILSGDAVNCSVDDLLALAKLSSCDEIFPAFDHLIEERRKKPANLLNRIKLKSVNKNISAEVRVVVYFNPEIFAEKRISAEKLLKRVTEFEENLNLRLRKATKSKRRERILANVESYLARDHLLDAFKTEIFEIKERGIKKLQVSISLNRSNWDKRRRYDGYSVIVSHPKIDLSAQEICRIYRAKNTVEASFRTIKSFIEIRPIRHYTDVKVKAHVTLCMLSLFLEKALAKSLQGTSSPKMALERLKTCMLNRYIYNGGSIYSITETNKEQDTILKQLKLCQLANDDFVREKITPRL